MTILFVDFYTKSFLISLFPASYHANLSKERHKQNLLNQFLNHFQNLLVVLGLAKKYLDFQFSIFRVSHFYWVDSTQDQLRLKMSQVSSGLVAPEEWCDDAIPADFHSLVAFSHFTLHTGFWHVFVAKNLQISTQFIRNYNFSLSSIKSQVIWKDTIVE